MAKVQSPLFGLAAGGALGESIVYSKWKGILYVRRYIIPANPNTEDQQTQRGFFKNGVDFWHSTEYLDTDKAAWDLWASAEARPMSGFNKMISEVIRVYLAGDIWKRFYAYEVWGEAPTTVEFAVREMDNVSDMVVKLRFGTDTHFFGKTRVLPWDPVSLSYTKEIDDLQSGVKYFGWIEGKKEGHEGTIGLVTFKTT